MNPIYAFKFSFLACLVSSAVARTLAGANITRDLQPLLSADAQIHLPGSDGYKLATTRWASAVQPGFDVVVKVASEVVYANAQNVPFLAIGGGHGSSTALKSAQGAIGIWMRGLNGTALAPRTNGSQAIIQPGSLSHEVISDLWDMGKQAAAGGCDCTSFTGPMLGGGHGILQGQYGLLADNLISARLVLANGSAITVSATQNPDLLWALKGAGHNFGIVTSFHYAIHPRIPGTSMDGYATANFTFTADKLEAVFTLANTWITAPSRPVNLMHYGLIAIKPTLSPLPVITLLLFWQGPSPIPAEYTSPLHALSPLSVVTKWVDLRAVNSIANADTAGAACIEGMGRQIFPTNLYAWNVTNLRAVLDIFASFPPYLRGSTMLLEGYPVNAVQAIAHDSTAYPDRAHNLLASPLLAYPPGNETMDREVEGFGRRIREAMQNGVGDLVSYVNYAHGDEGNEAVYGYERWRMERLRGLKKRYDPEMRFRFFEPIEV
ncbi:MAG: hypothetical protein Q9160_006291 [Pyrenula sp. 1 TL-2023]